MARSPQALWSPPKIPVNPVRRSSLFHLILSYSFLPSAPHHLLPSYHRHPPNNLQPSFSTSPHLGLSEFIPSADSWDQQRQPTRRVIAPHRDLREINPLETPFAHGQPSFFINGSCSPRTRFLSFLLLQPPIAFRGPCCWHHLLTLAAAFPGTRGHHDGGSAL